MYGNAAAKKFVKPLKELLDSNTRELGVYLTAIESIWDARNEAIAALPEWTVHEKKKIINEVKKFKS